MGLPCAVEVAQFQRSGRENGALIARGKPVEFVGEAVIDRLRLGIQFLASRQSQPALRLRIDIRRVGSPAHSAAAVSSTSCGVIDTISASFGTKEPPSLNCTNTGRTSRATNSRVQRGL